MAPLVRVVPFKLSAPVIVDFLLLLCGVRRLLGGHLVMGLLYMRRDLCLFSQLCIHELYGNGLDSQIGRFPLVGKSLLIPRTESGVAVGLVDVTPVNVHDITVGKVLLREPVNHLNLFLGEVGGITVLQIVESVLRHIICTKVFQGLLPL